MEVRLALVVLLGLATAVSQNAPPQQDSKTAPVTASDSTGPGSIGGPSYVIRIEDTLHIAVWREPELTSTMPVRPDGMISLPLINDVQAAGLTPMQLAAILTEKLKTYVATPRVTVAVTQMKPHQIYLAGEVLRHGAIALQPGMTMLQALATAGFTPFANTKGIYILRRENGQQQKIPFNYKQAMKGDPVAQGIMLKADDTIVVP
jgi:polysaccharide export outer membrane protein